MHEPHTAALIRRTASARAHAEAPGLAALVIVTLITLFGLVSTASSSASAGGSQCGASRGGFPVAGYPGLTGAVHVTAHRVRCPKALRTGHRIFFGQECVCPSSYSYGDRFRFDGYRCVVHRGEPQRFHCVRGSRVINIRTSIDQI